MRFTQDPVHVLTEDIADRLIWEAQHSEENRETHYMAGKLLRAFTDLFAPDWKDVEFAERMRMDREADRRAGVPWNGDEES